jgi:hypothetical protein
MLLAYTRVAAISKSFNVATSRMTSNVSQFKGGKDDSSIRHPNDANVTIDSDDGAVWLWMTSGKEHAGIKLSAQMSDPSIEEVLKEWARQQDQPPQNLISV